MKDSKYTGFNPPLKLALHPQFGKLVAGGKVYPINVEISPSGFCNAHCDFCFYADGALGDHRKEFLETDRTLRLLEELEELGVKSVSWTGGGDPSLHPHIDQLVSYTRLCNLKQGMFTNALAKIRFDPTLLDWVRVTMTDKPFNVENIRTLRQCKTLGFAFNWSGAQDTDYLKQTLDVAYAVKADYVQVRPALKFHGQTTDVEPPDFDDPMMQVTDYKFEDAKHKHDYKECVAYHLTPFVWEDGNVDVCSYMRKHDGYRLGNIYSESFKSIMDKAPSSVPVHDNCQVCCKLHESNKSIHAAREVPDKDFP